MTLNLFFFFLVINSITFERLQFLCKAVWSSAGPFSWHGAVTLVGWRWSESRGRVPNILANPVTYRILGLANVSEVCVISLWDPPT